MPGRCGATAETEDIEGQRFDFIVGVFVDEAVAGDPYLLEGFLYSSDYASGTAPGASAERTVFLTRAGADALDIDASMALFG
ncbi:hypothetical protein D3C84_1136400 [compost metagenome]